MTLAPIATYNSDIDLHLGHVPKIEDEVVYQELLDIHNAFEIILTSLLDLDSGSVTSLIAYKEARTSVDTKTEDYTLLDTDGTIKIEASANMVTITLPTAIGIKGTRYEIKCMIDTFRAFLATDAAELLDDSSDDFELYEGENLTVQSDGIGWIVL